MKRSDRMVLIKMIGYCDDVGSITKQFDNNEEALKNSIVYQYAAGMCILQIGELVTKLSSNIVLDYPSIPWKQIRAMRNVYAHDYENANIRLVWQTITEDIPALREQLQAILDKAGESDE